MKRARKSRLGAGLVEYGFAAAAIAVGAVIAAPTIGGTASGLMNTVSTELGSVRNAVPLTNQTAQSANKPPQPPPRSCLDIWEKDAAMAAGLYDIVNDIDGEQVTTEVYCEPGGWTVLAGHASYELYGFPFLAKFDGVKKSYAGGELYAEQGYTRSGYCYGPNPNATWETPFSFTEAKLDTRHRVHNATNKIKMGSTNVWKSCSGACAPGKVTIRTFQRTFSTHPAVHRLGFNMYSCQRYGGSGWGRYKYVAVR